MNRGSHAPLFWCALMATGQGEAPLCAEPWQPSFALGASSASAPTLATLEEPFSPRLHCGSHFLGWPRPEPAPSACGEVWRERRLRASASSGWAGARRALHLEQRDRPAAPGSEGLSTRASSCGGCARSPSSAGPPALRSISRRASAASPRGRARDLQPAMPEPPRRHGLLRGPSLPTSAAPCSAAPGPIDRPMAEECGRTARDWQAAPPAAPVWDTLGEASWAPESSGELENLYV
ncbi:phosphatidylinositol 4,5-bisphosphate 5-phosphatase A [Pan troglodytes]|uniref:phosphatidylinositol 4,5-bisphosphate 5-phosphatase A n=1 Tax=Pan troglodytes TaxID=9598 RepID=UPI003013597C